MPAELRFHLDECVARAVADGLRRRGIDVTTTQESDLLSADDLDQLAFATHCLVRRRRDRHVLQRRHVHHGDRHLLSRLLQDVDLHRDADQLQHPADVLV